jgi:glycosyltransferase involved in cell wall biosynthesis
MDTKISIIISARNYSKYLMQCIESCINQTIKPFEIIYSDDYSTDNSVQIAKKLGCKIVTQKKHSGVVKARNDGTKASKGNYLIFLDGDDYLAEDYIERMLEVLDDNTTVVYSLMNKVTKKGEQLIDVNCERNNFLWRENFINTSALIKKKDFISCGKWMTNEYNTHWDWHLYLRLSRYGKFKKSRAILNYRQHQHSNLSAVRQRYGKDLPEIRRNIMISVVKVTIGLIYGGREKGFIYPWMENLNGDIKILKNKPELIIINNSHEVLDLNKYNTFYSNIKIIDGNKVSMRTRQTRPLLSTALSDGYNTILENATGEIVHLREDDNLSEGNSFEKLFTFLTTNKYNATASAGLYMSRHQKRIVGGYYTDKEPTLIEKVDTINPMQVDFTGTGYIMFWKDLVPKFRGKTSYGDLSHDWAWSLALKASGHKMYILPTAMSRHYLDRTRFILPDINNISPKNNYTKITKNNLPTRLVKK